MVCEGLTCSTLTGTRERRRDGRDDFRRTIMVSQRDDRDHCDAADSGENHERPFSTLLS